MLVLKQRPGMRVQVILGDGRFGFVHSRLDGGKARFFLNFPPEFGIGRVYHKQPIGGQVTKIKLIETRRSDHPAALTRAIWEGGLR